MRTLFNRFNIVAHITLVLLLVIVGVFGTSLKRTFANTPFVVDSNLDTADAVPGDGICDDGLGNCTLRAAIDESNALAGPDNITFSTSMVIHPVTGYTITSQITIDGRSHATCALDGTRNIGVEVDGLLGAVTISIFDFNAGSNGSQILGLTINNSSLAGIHLENMSGFTLKCSNLGTNTTGSAVKQNSTDGINAINASDIVIGGVVAGDGNIISGNKKNAILMDTTTGLTIVGNYIGSDATGLIGLGNSDISAVGAQAIHILSSSNIAIGAAGASARNIIVAGQGGDNAGIALNMTGVSTVAVKNNYIGIGADGTTLLTNTGGGNAAIAIDAESGNISDIVIGGSIASGESNFINSGNDLGCFNSGVADTGTNTATNLTFFGNYCNINTAGNVISNTGGSVNIRGYDGVVVGDGTADHRNYFGGGGVLNILGTSLTKLSQNISVKGNYFGVNTSGVLDPSFGNPIAEISLYSFISNIVIGGTNPGDGNLIGDAQLAGILIFPNGQGLDGPLTDVSIIGNTIIGNTTGIFGLGPVDPITIKSNIITGNSSGGVVAIESPADPGIPTFSILQNSITNNAGNGIDLGKDISGTFPVYENIGPNPNDAGDLDTGPNAYLNHPIILKTEDVGGGIFNVTYAADVPAGDYRVEFFSNTTNGISSSFLGEGETYLDFDTFTSTGGIKIQTKVLTSTSDSITATITEDLGGGSYGATSEFSNAAPFGIDLGTTSGSETALTDNGAYHIIDGMYLGSCVNADDTINTDSNGSNQVNSFKGTGPCTDDRNGVAFDHASYIPSATAVASVEVSSDGYINVWIDSNSNGSFQNSGEHVIVNQHITTIGSLVPLTGFSVPDNAGTYKIRIRYTPYDPGSMLPIGEAIGGEVEDYTITVASLNGGGGGIIPVNKVCNNPKASNYTTGSGIGDASVCTYGPEQTRSNQEQSSSEIKNPITGTEGSCPAFTGYYKRGSQGVEIKKIQAFLNQEVGAKLPINGLFGPATETAVKKFQEKYFALIIEPWQPPTSQATGYWYKTTRMKANQLSGCAEIPVVLETNGKTWSLPAAGK